MELPESIRVKLSSEAAGSIALTPVVVQEMPVREIVELMLGIAGKDVERIREMLRRGTLVSGASRFRWEGIEADAPTLHTLLATFPDADPGRPFNATACFRAVLRGGTHHVELPVDACSKRKFLRRRSFWNSVMEAAAGTVTYLDYSYKERADRYHATLSPQAVERLRTDANLLVYPTLTAHIQAFVISEAEFFTRR